MSADLLVTIMTTLWWCQNKTVDKYRHDLEGGLLLPADDVSPNGCEMVGKRGGACNDDGLLDSDSRPLVRVGDNG